MTKKEVQEKQKASTKEKFGVEHALKNPELLKKAENTKLKKYGNSHFSNPKKALQTKKKNKSFSSKKPSKRSRNKRLKWPFLKVLDDIFRGDLRSTKYRVRCTRCGEEWKTLLMSRPSCPSCSKTYPTTSKGHQEIYDFLKTYFSEEILINDRLVLKGGELDLFVSSKKFAIEYNGLYFHSDRFKSKNYHKKKTQRCSLLGIQLFHVYEHQWYYQKELIQSMLLAKLGIFSRKLHARKCQIRELSSPTKKDFFERTHIQGDKRSSKAYGLFFQQELVAAISFKKTRRNPKASYELVRFSSELNTSIRGGFSKLFSYALKDLNCSSVIHLSDRTVGSGELFLRQGFHVDSILPPDFFYAKNLEVFSREQCLKHRLRSLLTNFSPSLTEEQNMNRNGFFRVWDCGSLVLLYKTEKGT